MIEVSSDHFEENSIEKTTNNNTITPESASILQEAISSPKLTVKTVEELFEHETYTDSKYSEAREMVVAMAVLPTDLEVREIGVFARETLGKGTRYGPFQGKWAGLPDDHRFAWEVSETFAKRTKTVTILMGKNRANKGKYTNSFCLQQVVIYTQLG